MPADMRIVLQLLSELTAHDFSLKMNRVQYPVVKNY